MRWSMWIVTALVPPLVVEVATLATATVVWLLNRCWSACRGGSRSTDHVHPIAFHLLPFLLFTAIRTIKTMMNVPSFVRIHVLPPFRTNGPNKPDIVLAINSDGCWRDNNHLVVTGRQMGLSMYVKSALDQVSYDPASVWKSHTPKCRRAAELQALCPHS